MENTMLVTDTKPRWVKTTRWLHALMALGIIAQLILSQLMTGPDHLDKATSLEKFSLESHEWVGLGVTALLFLHWIWLFMASSDVKLSKLFPWTPTSLKRIGNEARSLLKSKKLPPAGEHGGLSGLVHGLGILIASAMSATGVGLYVVMDFMQDGFNNPLFEEIANLHGFFSNLMWAYLVAHVLAAAWHEYLGERIIAAMFRP